MTLDFEAIVAAAAADPAVVGLVLKGSRAHDGMTTRHSDHDLYVILDDGASASASADGDGDAASGLAALDGYRSARLDLVVTTLERFRRPADWERYAISRSRVLLDRRDGEVARIVAAMGRLDAEEAFRSGAALVDAYANSLYRSVKNHRDGNPLAGHLDAAAGVGFLLDLLFALDRRPRPYNKYLAWELDRFPLPGWDGAALLDTVARITATGEVAPQQRLFARVEAAARAAGHAAVLDAWGEDLLLMRPDPDSPGDQSS
ncbi:hypothetical protein GCM10018790_16460 [Kitasatospora xanthocidica]|uniref:hypothetical protein n=1 Tax=Kitasatospora xanthocidica TaxID=83382 RepID=UPI00167284B1|nr:hypothetical protein [Kitasatospora xanthocidica]GHF39359.1 hypothetical protein GCM10018790_16460 [Kitasatospora xanthocidica]